MCVRIHLKLFLPASRNLAPRHPPTPPTPVFLRLHTRTTPVHGVSNPFVMSAMASKHIKAAHDENPAHRHGLEKLQKRIDDFTTEVERDEREERGDGVGWGGME